MNHLDLFSGIGGFALAASHVWPEHRVVAFCEIDEFCQKVLKKHWPNVPIISDIRKMDGSNYADISLLTTGFPCQPASIAGKRRGRNDDRWLWPECYRVIQDAAPKQILLENVPGLLSVENEMAFNEVLTDLGNAGYETQTFVVPAAGADAPHRRYRVWIVAKVFASHSDKLNGDNRGYGAGQVSQQPEAGLPGGQHRQPQSGMGGAYDGISSGLDEYWDGDWERKVPRTTKMKNKKRIQALGNSIVPQVAAMIMKAMER